tara:strand:- start:304 stop:708 length:405 start_codon:yes stop_codon:yes gene_type:complete
LKKLILDVSRFGVLVFLNLFIFLNSKYIDVEQFEKDINIVFGNKNIDQYFLFLSVSIVISLLTVIMIYIFRPFIEIYLLYFFRLTFFFLVNLVSLSTIYILLRVYGYSRLYLLIYLIISSIFLFYYERISNKFV